MNNALRKGSDNREVWGEKMVCLFLLCCSFFFFCRFFVDSGNGERLLEKKNLLALGETGIFLLYSFFILLFRKTTLRSRRALLFFLSFPLLLTSYLHRFLLPLLFSFFYFFFLASILCYFLSGKINHFLQRCTSFRYSEKDKMAAFLALPFVLIQISRSNIALDYDSLRYGLRSAWILFSPEGKGGGILSFVQAFFSSHGLINAVYSYPKGLELLTAPLSFLPGYGFLLAFQIWIYIAIAFVLYFLLRDRKDAELALGILAFFFFSSVGNMAITMKTDNLTLLLQLLSLYFYGKGERKNSLSMLILTYSLKPTAVVFSTLLFIGFFLDSLIKGTIGTFFFGKGEPEEKRYFHSFGTKKEGSTTLLFVSLLFTCLITLRTFWITGLPFSTTFTGIFKAMGFSVKWPFNLDAHVDYSGALSLQETLLSFGKRLFFFLFYPVGEDMAHVGIAWSGIAFPAILFFAAGKALKMILRRFSPGRKKEKGDVKDIELPLVFFLISFFSLLSFVMLWQIDGNYYSLWECLALLLAFGSPLWKKEEEKKKRKWTILLAPFLYLPALLTTLLTSWAGAVGFTPIDPVNKGYYDHLSVEMEEQAERGSLPLFLKMAENPRNHVLAVSETPDCYRIPCVVESITDVEGSGGSPGLYDDSLYFAWFLKWAKTDYIYIEKSFLEEEREARAKEMIIQMANLGILIEPEFANLTKTQESLPEYLLVKVNQPRLEYAWREESYPVLTKEEEEDAKSVLNWIDYGREVKITCVRGPR